MRATIKYFCVTGLILSLLFTNLAMASPNNEVSKQLFNLLATDDLSKKYTTLMLLSHTTLSDQVYNDLKKFISKEKNPVIRLTAYYVLAKRTQEREYITLFIDNYPKNDKHNKINSFHWKHSQYLSDVTISSPLQAYLAHISTTNDKALDKLVSLFHYTDSTEELNYQIAGLYKINPNRVEPVLNKYKVDEAVIKTYRIHLPNQGS